MSVEVKRVFSGAPWERTVGYCRALKVGNQIFVSGTAPVSDDGKVFAPGDPYQQAMRCFEIIKQALAELDCPVSKVARTRVYVADIKFWEDFGRAHQEYFGAHPPVTSMVEVKGLIDSSMLIEVEAEAVI